MKTTLLVFTLNEIEGMKAVMPRIRPEWCDEIIVLDGGSTDGTLEYASERGYRIFHQGDMGMGGAFRGLADNWSAAYWNPAGLAQLSQSEFNFMGIMINPIPEYQPTIRYGGYEVGYKNDLTFP